VCVFARKQRVAWIFGVDGCSVEQVRLARRIISRRGAVAQSFLQWMSDASEMRLDGAQCCIG